MMIPGPYTRVSDLPLLDCSSFNRAVSFTSSMRFSQLMFRIRASFCLQDSFKTQTNAASSGHHIFSDTVTGDPFPPRSMSVRFPANRTSQASQASSTAKGCQLESTDENVFQNRSSLGIARTVRRTLSGGLSNILRPFQPPIMKVH